MLENVEWPEVLVSTHWIGCPGRPEFVASSVCSREFLEDYGLGFAEDRLVRGVLRDKCSVTGQVFTPDQHSWTTIQAAPLSWGEEDPEE